jgi:hypothetical protein
MSARLPLYFDALADYSEMDVQRLEAVLGWLETHPDSNLYPRQMPLAGVDTKWLETRMPMLADLAGGQLGFRELPRMVRFRILDPALRECVGGLGDVAAAIGDIANLRLPIARAYIVENLQTGLAFEDVPGSVVFMGLGYGAASLAQLPWLASAESVYWGDLDTHGFAILNSVRSFLPSVRSVLMDESTLVRNRAQWVEEPEQWTATVLPLLNDSEQLVYAGLKGQQWGHNVRLEQERIAWDDAWETLVR